VASRPGFRRGVGCGVLLAGALLAGALLAGALLACGSGEPSELGPNVVLIVLESLRTDHIGAYGGHSRSRPEIPVTPAIDAFAARATVYEDAHAVTSWTLASHASLFTGLYPTGHQTDGPMDRLDDSYPTLAEALARRGYQTAGVVSGPYLRRTHNLSQGFEIYDDSIASPRNDLAHDDVTNPRMEAALHRFIEAQRDPRRPFFLFAYFWDPHYDFLPPPPYDRSFVGERDVPIDGRHFESNPAIHAQMPPAQLDYLLAQYAGELRWTDDHLARFFWLLEERGLWDDTLIILTADHGEEFFDHGEKGHKHNLYTETVHVPLIIKFPGQREGRRDARLVSLVDLAPTILEVCGAPPIEPMHGRSLLDAPPSAPRSIYFELLSIWYQGGQEAQHERWYGIREGDDKLVWRSDGAPAELYDVRRDPGERQDARAERPRRAAELRERFESAMQGARRDAARYRRGGPATLSEEDLQRLRELGYLDS